MPQRWHDTPLTNGASVSERDALVRACALARRGQGEVEPNPMVGAVVLRDGEVLGEGWHRAWGGPHAEIEALAAAGEAARGATLCVTLEPCSTSGKTGPCTDAVIAAGIKHVVIGCADPNPHHQGRGLERLLAAGVHVDLLDLPEAHALLARFERSLSRRRPYVLAKWAMSHDGAIAPGAGGRATISCAESQDLVHRWRAHLDAILVGVNTVIADDPQLTARGPLQPRRPLRRVVLDPSLRIPLGSRLVASASETPTWVFAGDDADQRVVEVLSGEGVQVFRVPRGPDWLPRVFAMLRLQGVQRLMVEGGAHTLASCLAADLIDEVAIFLAPQDLGAGALAAVNGLSLGRLSPHEVATSLRLTDCRITSSGVDTLLRGFRG
jgi:diaminohydroxyphosphoribosylaminopyrimidine deaminase/5-amino-6-(5-phosphoribosylamino)uracil reductase